MNTACFDAEISISPGETGAEGDLLVCFQQNCAAAGFQFYQAENLPPDKNLVRVQCSRPLKVKWKSDFEIKTKVSRRFIGSGVVLYPESPLVSNRKQKSRVDFLLRLQGSPADMIAALSRDKGVEGIGAAAIRRFSGLSRDAIHRTARDLEQKGDVRILTFDPLFIVSQSGVEYLGKKIAALVDRYHAADPDHLGMEESDIASRFKLHPKALSLSLMALTKAGRIRRLGSRYVPGQYKIAVTPEEENILKQMEEMTSAGEFPSVSIEELKSRFRLSSAKMDRLLTLLIERKKIVQGKEGFFLDADWLKELIAKLQTSDMHELPVSEFKKMTGLTRKYAIPLLELLDQKGVTQRVGTTRIILRPDSSEGGKA